VFFFNKEMNHIMLMNNLYLMNVFEEGWFLLNENYKKKKSIQNGRNAIKILIKYLNSYIIIRIRNVNIEKMGFICIFLL